MTRITVLVSNDLTHDQRVRKVCDTLINMGFTVHLVGRKHKSSSSIERPYRCTRFGLLFNRGALFYAALNIRLFLFLLFTRTDGILANDLDTLWPAFVVSRLRKKFLVYDSHEYFTEAAGLTGRPFPKRVWERIEGRIFPQLKQVYTVNDSIADIYHDKYEVDVKVVRNVPPLLPKVESNRKELGLPEDEKIMLLQGAFIDHDRGCLEAIHAMPYVDGVILLIIGEGQAIPEARALVSKLLLEDRVKFMPKMPFEELRKYTAAVDLGLSLDKPNHLNYKLSLPNKLFDYIHAGIPVLVSPLPELVKVLDKFNIGQTITSHDPHDLAKSMQEAINSPQLDTWRSELEKAREYYNWGNEENTLREIYGQFLR